jgi:hypothetical protein
VTNGRHVSRNEPSDKLGTVQPVLKRTDHLWSLVMGMVRVKILWPVVMANGVVRPRYA